MNSKIIKLNEFKKNPIDQLVKLKISKLKNYQIFSSVQIILKNEKINGENKKNCITMIFGYF